MCFYTDRDIFKRIVQYCYDLQKAQNFQAENLGTATFPVQIWRQPATEPGRKVDFVDKVKMQCDWEISYFIEAGLLVYLNIQLIG
jgi:hypothetical protein